MSTARWAVYLNKQDYDEIVMKYMVVIEKTEDNFSAYVPDLPGCVATADTRAEVSNAIKEAIAFHIEGMQEVGEAIPGPSTEIEYVEVSAA